MSTSPPAPNRPTIRFTRARQGRILGGVCAGQPRFRGLSRTALRAIAILTGLCGIGVIGYLACWLVLPAVDEDGEQTPPVVVFAAASGGLVLFLLLAGLSAAATAFGLGWLIVALTAGVLVVAIGPLANRVPAWLAVLGVAALAVPSVAVALSPLRLALSDQGGVRRPAAVTRGATMTFTSGLATQLIDLRDSRFPAAGTVHLHIRAGIRRTIVALPADRCVHVNVRYTVHPYAGQLATLLAGHDQPAFHGVVVFGTVYGALASQLTGTASAAGSGDGPTLDIRFSSQGGSLFVRDYPAQVNPQVSPTWPGYIGGPERPPNLAGESPAARRQIVRDYRLRRRAELTSDQRVDAEMKGPCAS